MSPIRQLTTFHVGSDLFGIDVMKVQEVTAGPTVVPVPLAPPFVRGLVNLRGQIATALGLRELFERGGGAESGQMSVVCKIDGNLVSLLVDSIGQVIEVDAAAFEPSPETIPPAVRKFVSGIYKTNEGLLSVLDLESLSLATNPQEDTL